MKRYSIVTIGSATRDVFLRSKAMRIISDDQFSTGEAECFALGSKIEIDDIVFETGGGATNTAVGFSRLGFRAAFMGKIGLTDSRGQALLRELKHEGVGIDLVTKDRQHMTGYSVILLTPRGERTVLVFRGASGHFRAVDLHWSGFRAPWLYVSSLGSQLSMVRSIWAAAQRRQMKIAWNPGAGELAVGLERLKPLLRQATIVSLNQEEATKLFGLDRFQHREAFERLRMIVGGVVVVTLGTDGALGGDRHQAWHAGTHSIRVIDTTGAGDAFGCGFVAKYIRTKGDIARSLQFATANAESVVRAIGAKSGLLHSFTIKQPVAVSRIP